MAHGDAGVVVASIVVDAALPSRQYVVVSRFVVDDESTNLQEDLLCFPN